MNKSASLVSDDHTFDYTKITDNIYIGSDLCKGRHCAAHSAAFKKLGICAELNLESERKERPSDNIDIYAWLPVEDKHSPSTDQFLIGTAIINEAVLNGNIIYVHCRYGHGRSPIMVAAYFIRYKKYNVKEAINYIRNKRREIHPNENQLKALEDFAAKWLK